MKKYIYYLILFLFLLLPSNVFAIVNPTTNFYINDYANILSTETEQYILNKSVALNNADGTQIVVVTVPNLEGNSLEEYANELFNTWGIGSSEKNNGLLLLLALEEREFRVEVGDGLGGILPDGKTGRFQDDYIIPYLRNNDWDNGIKNGYDAFYSEIVKLNDLEIDYNTPTTYYNDENVSMDDLSFYPFWCFIGMTIGIVAGTTIRKLKKEDRNKKTLIYLIIWVGLFCVAFFKILSLLIPLMSNLITFLGGRFGNGSVGGSYRSGGGSFGGFSGGGGRSSGGGSSRGF